MIVSFSELFNAYTKCKKNKANTINAIRFQTDLITNLWELYYEINYKTYEPKKYICFLVQSPKLREVFASDFRDRVVHHLLVNDLEPLFELIFIHDSYSCRKNKGTHKAVKRVQQFSRKRDNTFYMQLDIKNFFLSIDKNILYKKVPHHKSLLYTVSSKGLPIGNLTSQFFANVYLDILDNFLKRELKVKSYVRYVDDFVLFSSSKEQLLKQKKLIEQFLEKKLSLQLRDDYKIAKVENGIDFLGYIIRPKYMLIRKRVVNNFKYKKMQFLKNEFDSNNSCSVESAKKFKQMNASYYGHFKWADSYRLIQKYKMESWL